MMVKVFHGTSQERAQNRLIGGYLPRGLFVWDSSTLEEDYPRDQAEELAARKAECFAWRFAEFKYGPGNEAVLEIDISAEYLKKGALSAHEKMLTQDLIIGRQVQVQAHFRRRC